ncbi:MAG TPA: site-specific integrase [Polaromonas sp.]
MATVNNPAGETASVISSTTPQLPGTASPEDPTSVGCPVSFSTPARNDAVTIRQLIDAYMAAYAGRDVSRPQRLAWWAAKIGDMPLTVLTDDHVFYALEELAAQRSRFYAGVDADGKPIYKAKHQAMAPATINRYAAALGAVLTWAVKKRLAPRGWDNPCRRIEHRAEDNEVVRFLSDAERIALLAACKRSTWPKLYLLVLLGLTTGARLGELQRMRWRDLDFERCTCTVSKTKNGDRKILPLTAEGLIDPRSRAAMKVQKAFNRVLDVGGVFVVFAASKTNLEIKIGKLNRYKSFEPHEDWSYTEWSFLDEFDDMHVSHDHGEEMHVADARSAIGKLLQTHLRGSVYDCTIKGGYRQKDPWNTIAANKFGHAVALQRTCGSNGLVVVLPQLKDKAGFLAVVKLFRTHQ